MGLDMYLTGTTATGEQVDLAYWRKANAIHNWMVDNLQNGNDDCGSYQMSQEDVEQLLFDCDWTLSNPGQEEDCLPTASGFFFGSTEYDERYYGIVRYTMDVCLRAKKFLLVEGNQIHYSSSW